MFKMYTPRPRNFRSLGPSKLQKIAKLCSDWAEKPKFRGKFIIKKYQKENFEGENYVVMVHGIVEKFRFKKVKLVCSRFTFWLK